MRWFFLKLEGNPGLAELSRSPEWLQLNLGWALFKPQKFFPSSGVAFKGGIFFKRKIGWFFQRFHLVWLESSWFSGKKTNIIESKDKGLFLSKFSWYLTIVKIIKRPYQPKNHDFEIILCRIKYHTVILLPNFYLSATSSLFFLAFFLHIYGDWRTF